MPGLRSAPSGTTGQRLGRLGGAEPRELGAERGELGLRRIVGLERRHRVGGARDEGEDVAGGRRVELVVEVGADLGRRHPAAIGLAGIERDGLAELKLGAGDLLLAAHRDRGRPRSTAAHSPPGRGRPRRPADSRDQVERRGRERAVGDPDRLVAAGGIEGGDAVRVALEEDAARRRRTRAPRQSPRPADRGSRRHRRSSERPARAGPRTVVAGLRGEGAAGKRGREEDAQVQVLRTTRSSPTPLVFPLAKQPTRTETNAQRQFNRKRSEPVPSEIKMR